jgi:hypothetical protein
MKNVMTGTYIRKSESGEENFNFDFYTELSMVNKLKFVKSVTDTLIDDKSYNSIIRDLVFDFFIVEIFTDIDTTDIRETNFINNAEQLLEETNIVDIVKANMEIGLLEELNEAIDLNIQYITGIHPNPLNEALAGLVGTLENKIKEVDLDTMMKMAQKFANMVGELTPDSVVNAYINSDMHKKNLEEIAEAKAERAESEAVGE